ncbi:sulfite exporter TauE/SafE family protein [Terrarubrum flagellatum]|uniref:sulfite exporter TauE/SafE family protein n=1 Tax=Terrirubrum flagellatum TaxID=2895980 RepID=UPI0031456A16
MEIYLPIAESPVNMLVILGMSAAVGFISGMFGVGGGFLMTPFLIFTGIPPAIAVASVSAQIAGSSMTGVISYFRKNAVDVRLGGLLIAGGAVGTVLGIMFFNQMRRLGQLELVIVLSYVVLFGVIGGLMLLESLRSLAASKQAVATGAHKRERPWYFELPLRMKFPRSRMAASVIPIMGLAIGVSFAGAVLGIGGGFILVPALIYLFHVPTSVVIGTSLMQILATMLAATILHAVTNQSVDMVLAILLIVGGVIGAQFGARAGQNLRAEVFRLLLAIMVLGVGLRFASDIVARPNDPFSVRVEQRAR